MDVSVEDPSCAELLAVTRAVCLQGQRTCQLLPYRPACSIRRGDPFSSYLLLARPDVQVGVSQLVQPMQENESGHATAGLGTITPTDAHVSSQAPGDYYLPQGAGLLEVHADASDT
jgi:proline racemase